MCQRWLILLVLLVGFLTHSMVGSDELPKKLIKPSQ